MASCKSCRRGTIELITDLTICLQAENNQNMSATPSVGVSPGDCGKVPPLHDTASILKEILMEMKSSREVLSKEMQNNGDALKDMKACIVDALNEVKRPGTNAGSEHHTLLAPTLLQYVTHLVQADTVTSAPVKSRKRFFVFDYDWSPPSSRFGLTPETLSEEIGAFIKFVLKLFHPPALI